MTYDITLKSRPKTGQGIRERESLAEPGKWLIRFITGERKWVHEDDFIVTGDEDYRVE